MLAKGLVTKLPLGTCALSWHRAALGQEIVCALRHTLRESVFWGLWSITNMVRTLYFSFSAFWDPLKSTESRTAGAILPDSQCSSGNLLPSIPARGSALCALLQQDSHHLSPSLKPARTAGAQGRPPVGSWRDPQVPQDLKVFSLPS